MSDPSMQGITEGFASPQETVLPITPAKPMKPSEKADNDPDILSKRANVKEWQTRITNDKKKYENDFKRMVENINFARGLQREGQDSPDTDRYVANVTLRNINQKVAVLYARNPTAEWQKRKRLNFQVWDGKLETLVPVAQSLIAGGQPSPQQVALIMDYLHGTQHEAMIEKVGETLQIAYQYQIDEHDPDFKEQMKSLIRRVCTCGVGYTSIAFARDVESILRSSGPENTLTEQAKRALQLSQELEDTDPDTSPKSEQLRSLLAAMAMSMGQGGDEYSVKERLVFDWLPSTAVIPDSNCTCLRGFVGAQYITIEYLLPLETVNAYFETDVSTGGGVTLYKGEGNAQQTTLQEQQNDPDFKPKVTLWRVLDKRSKTDFYLVQGWKDYIREPETVSPCVPGFWPIGALTFNETESLPNSKATIFPPSDVELMRPMQKEYNRMREELRKHRNANAPKYVTQKGWLSKDDKAKLMNAESNSVIEVEGVPPGGDVAKGLATLQHPPIDPAVYDVNTCYFDILNVIGAQDANFGQPNPQGTATGQSIAEQSRNTGISSNIDDLDDFLTWLANCGGSLWMQESSQETNQQVVGPGAAWPAMPEERAQFLNSVYLKHRAASSGRPNKVGDLQNWQMIAPVLQAAGANPMFMVRETLRRVDDQLDAEDAFPLQPPQGAQQQSVPQGQGPQQTARAGKNPPKQSRPGPGTPPPNAQPISPTQQGGGSQL